MSDDRPKTEILQEMIEVEASEKGLVGVSRPSDQSLIVGNEGDAKSVVQRHCSFDRMASALGEPCMGHISRSR